MALRRRLEVVIRRAIDRAPASKVEMAGFLRSTFWPTKSQAAAQTHFHHCLNPDRPEKLAVSEFFALCAEFELVEPLEWLLSLMGYEVRRRWRDDQLSTSIKEITAALVEMGARIDDLQQAQRCLTRAATQDAAPEDVAPGDRRLRWCRPPLSTEDADVSEEDDSVRRGGGAPAVAGAALSVGAPPRRRVGGRS